MRSTRILAIAAMLIGTGCPTGDDDDTGGDDDTGDDDATGDDDTGDDWPAFALGVEYSEPGLGAAYAPTGVAWAKPRLEAFEWGSIEPQPPEGSVHTYDWSCADAMVLDSQLAGTLNIQSYLSPRSEWGSVDVSGLINGDVAPAPAFEADFRAWIRALIERYDGDGIDDAPGLVTPVRYWVVGPEWTGFWPSDDHDAYLAFAEAVAEEARSVYPEVRLGTIPILLSTEFAGNEPSDAEIEDRLWSGTDFRNSTEGVMAILDRPDLFDYVNVHALGHYTELPPELRWFRAEMAARGYDHPVWFDDAFPMGPLANYLNYPALYPVDADQQDALWEILVGIARFEDGWVADQDWLRALIAAETVKKVLTALGEGAIGIQIGNTEDWVHDSDPESRYSFIAVIGAAAFMGLRDVDHSQGYTTCDERIPGDPRPAFRNLELLVAKLGDGDFDAVEPLGALEGMRGYRLVRGGDELWAVWHEDGVLRLPGEHESPVPHTFDAPAGATSATVTHAVTDPAAPPAVVEQVAVAGGQLQLDLSSVPQFVEFP